MKISEWRTHAERVLGHLAIWDKGPKEDPSATFSWFRNGQGPNMPRGSIHQMRIAEGKVWFRNEIKSGKYSEWSWLGDVERTRSIFKRLLDAATAETNYNRQPIDLNQPESRCSACGALGPSFCQGCRSEQRGDF